MEAIRQSGGAQSHQQFHTVVARLHARSRTALARFSNLAGWLPVFWNRPNRYQKHLNVSQSGVRKVKSAKVTRKKGQTNQ